MDVGTKLDVELSWKLELIGSRKEDERKLEKVGSWNKVRSWNKVGSWNEVEILTMLEVVRNLEA